MNGGKGVTVLSIWLRRARPGGLLLLMVAFYAAVALGVAFYAAWSDRAASRRAVETAAIASASLLEERVSRILEASEHVTQRVAERLLAGEIGAMPVNALTDQLEAAPYLANILVLDPSGRLILQGRGGTGAAMDVSGQAWFRALETEGTVTVVGGAAVDEGARELAFPVARRVSGHEGRTVAIVAALVASDTFQPFIQRMHDAQAATLGICRLDGRILVRQPWRGGELPRNMGDGALLNVELPKAAAGIFRERSSYDGLDRVIAYRAIPGRDLVVWVGGSEARALEAWRRRGWGIAGLALFSIAVMAGLSLLLRRELSRERRASAELVSLNRDLERSNADLEQFAYIASHDLKEPLRNIASYVQLLQRRYQGRLDPDADAFIGYTVDGVRRLQAIINELLAYSRIGTGQMMLAPVQAGALVSTALAHLKGVIAEAQAAVEVKGPLPVVEADSAQLGSLFQNLIGNALKYRREDVRAEITIGCEDRGGDWAFYVRDNGIGIDPQYHRQIFDLFKRLHPRDTYPGTGIGLAICQRVVERHGGRIWVESSAGRGSTFWFALPKHPGI